MCTLLQSLHLLYLLKIIWSITVLMPTTIEKEKITFWIRLHYSANNDNLRINKTEFNHKLAHFRPPYWNSLRVADWKWVISATAVNPLRGRPDVTQITQFECDKRGTRTMSAITYIVLIAFAIVGIQYWIKNKTYLFQAEDIARISKRHIRKGNSHNLIFSVMTQTSTNTTPV